MSEETSNPKEENKLLDNTVDGKPAGPQSEENKPGGPETGIPETGTPEGEDQGKEGEELLKSFSDWAVEKKIENPADIAERYKIDVTKPIEEGEFDGWVLTYLGAIEDEKRLKEEEEKLPLELEKMTLRQWGIKKELASTVVGIHYKLKVEYEEGMTEEDFDELLKIYTHD